MGDWEERSDPMQTHVAHYPSRERMEEGVKRLSGEGWLLQTLRKLPDEAVEAEFVRLTVDPSPQSLWWADASNAVMHSSETLLTR